MYEIPNQLVYKERIIFNLTFGQLLYAFIFLPVILLIFKLDFSFEIKVFLSLFPVLLAVALMYFNLFNHLKIWYGWFISRKIRIGKLGTLMEIKNCHNKLIQTKNKKVAILKVEPINFKIKTKKEKEAISYSFQKFLNSLDFPIQILMTTENLNLDRYLSSLNERIKEGYKEFFNDYEKSFRSIISRNDVSNRSFYIVIPEKTDIGIQIKICKEKLSSLNLKTSRLKGKEIKKLLKNLFGTNNLDSKKRKSEEEEISIPKNFWSKLNFFMQKVKKYIDDQKNLPVMIENYPDYLFMDKKYMRTIYASGYPRSVESGFLDKIISSAGDFNLSLHIEPHSIENTFVMLNKELQKQRADLYAAKLKNQLNSSLEIQYSDTLKTLENLQKGDEKLFNISLYITCKATSKKELDLLSQKVESELNSLMIIPKRANFRMIQGLKSCMPILDNSLKTTRYVTTNALSAFFPFTSQFLEADNTGVWLGLNKNNIPIIKDIFNLSNPNGTILAQSGGGKSYFCKLLITRYLLNGTKVMVIDPQGEYTNLVSHFKGQRIDLSKESDTIINPLDLMGHDYIEKRLSLIDLIKIMIGDLSDIQRACIDKALTITYKKQGITKNPDTWNNEPPILSDLVKVLNQMEQKASKVEQTTINSISSRLEMYVSGVFSFFNRKTNLDFDNDFVCFDVGNLPSQVKPAVMFLVLDYIYMKMKSNLDRKILLIDEAWSLLSRAEDAGYIFEIVKTCRKFNLGLILINQEVEGLLDSRAGKSVLANSSYTFLMRQKPAVIDNICRTFNLSSQERIHLLTAPIGEGLLIMEDDHSEMKVVASPKEHELITTNPDELKIINKESRQKTPKNVKIKIDENKRYFRKSKLDKDAVKFLLDEGYQVKKYKSLLTNNMETFLLQPRHNESFMHLFMTHNISEFLEKNGIETELFTTKKPDIVFEINGKMHAIEIETGSVLSKVSRMKEKLEVLNKYDEWLFVVTNKNKVKKYKKFGDAVDKRYVKFRLNKLLKLSKKSKK